MNYFIKFISKTEIEVTDMGKKDARDHGGDRDFRHYVNMRDLKSHTYFCGQKIHWNDITVTNRPRCETCASEREKYIFSFVKKEERKYMSPTEEFKSLRLHKNNMEHKLGDDKTVPYFHGARMPHRINNRF